MAVSLDMLHDELVYRVLCHWLQTSDAPMTLRHCTAKYFDEQHGLGGILTKKAIRKVSPSHSMFNCEIFNPQIEPNWYPDHIGETLYETWHEEIILPMCHRIVDLDFDISENDYDLDWKSSRCQCPKQEYFIYDTKYMRLIFSNLEDEVWYTRYLLLKCKTCRHSSILCSSDYTYQTQETIRKLLETDFFSLSVQDVYKIIAV